MNKRIGLIGIGDIAQKAYLPVIAQRSDMDLVGLMSRSGETVDRVAGQYRIPGRFTELDALLRQEPDAVFVHAPTEAHYDIVSACLSAGVNVYVDKPLSYDIGESERLASLAERKGKLLAVGFNRRFAPLYQEAKAWLEEAGGFNVCIAAKHRIRQQRHSAKHTLYDDLLHMIDLLVWLGSKNDKQVASYIEQTDEAGRLVHATGSLRLGNAAAVFTMDRFAGADLEKLELHGSGRSVEVTNMETATLYDKQGGERRRSFGNWDTTLYRRGFAGVIDHFLVSLDEPEQCVIRADQVLETHRLVEKLCGH